MFKKQPNFEPELGQALLSNNSFFQDEAWWACEGLLVLREILNQSKILEWENIRDYDGSIFAYRPYCWCDAGLDGDEDDPHYNGCPPNFEHYPSGLKITWYKHEGRGITANRELKAMDWWDVLAECVKEIKEYQFK